MKKEVICRSIINILDVKHSYDYDRFSHENLYDELLNYGQLLYKDDVYNEYKKIIENNKDIIHHFALNQNYTLQQFNQFMEELRQFKRTFVLNKEALSK